MANDQQQTHSDTSRADTFPVFAKHTYLDTATQGPLPTPTCQALAQAVAAAQFGSVGNAGYTQPAEAARAHLARLLHVQADDIALTANTTHGVNICARGIDWRAGDNVVLYAREFPSLLRAWLQLRELGVEVRLIPAAGVGPTVAELMAAVDARTRAVVCSAVAWDSGYRIDLETLGRRCAAAGALLIVDGIQAVGAVEFNPQALGISAVAFHGYKWLLAGFGCGALYVAPAALDAIRPRFVGEQAFVLGSDPADDAPLQPGARRYGAGGDNALGLVALAASLAQIETHGMPQIAAHNRALGVQLTAGLQRLSHVQIISPLDAAQRASLVVFTLGDTARDAALVEQLRAHGIIVALRRRGVRVSPHFFNTAADIDQLLAAIGEYVHA